MPVLSLNVLPSFHYTHIHFLLIICGAVHYWTSVTVYGTCSGYVYGTCNGYVYGLRVTVTCAVRVRYM